MDSFQRSIETIARAVADARCVCVLTGAGISAESGLATFRSDDTTDADDPQAALWSRFSPMDLATVRAFERDPKTVTSWYEWRFCRARDAQPNAGHGALAELQQQLQSNGRRFTLLTQNVDGLHQRAGSTDVVELHGTIHTWHCTKTGHAVPLTSLDFSEKPIRSPAGGLYRPSIVWFGEQLPEDAISRADDASATCDVFISIGTSATVYPAAGLASVARMNGAKVFEINLDETPISREVDITVRAKSGQALPIIAEQVCRYMKTT
ncbi:MAG: NAD-dependent deacylase [Phycisphaeraceae bacterium]|nr:NAD-dependent deacylase [Phycisphaerales bacterium]MCB9861219.1 NAD-dependent deacylase [Phycisphaeraceae bacterium]